jgi:uncharacterized membrane protein YphA (DoxX/SURF4 family)
MKINKSILFFYPLILIIGLLFIYSGYTKLYPIEPFEFTFVDLGIASWRTAPFIARFLIGLEFFIGLLLIFGISIKRFTIYLTSITLILFSVYLIIIMIINGNNGNCGCFGTAISMTPLQALIKNIVMLLACFFIYKRFEGFNYKKFNKWAIGLLAISSFTMPHVLNYIDFEYSSSYLTKKEDHFKLELDSLYKNAKINTPPKTLSKGKHIIAFMSMTCSHCRIAAKKMRLMKDKNKNLPIYFVLNGDTSKIKPFFDDTKAQNINYCLLNGKSFVYLAGLQMPTIYLVNNEIVENWITYLDLDQSEVEKWLKQ